MNRACFTCRYWHQSAVSPGPELTGLCRRNAPRDRRTGCFTIADAIWPTTGESDWCGDYQRVRA